MSDREQPGPEAHSSDDVASWASEPARAIEDPEALPTPPADEGARGRFGLRWPRRRRDEEAEATAGTTPPADDDVPLVPLPLTRADDTGTALPLLATSEAGDETNRDTSLLTPPAASPAAPVAAPPITVPPAAPTSWSSAAGVEPAVSEPTAPFETTAVIVARTLDIPVPTDTNAEERDGEEPAEGLRRLLPVPVNAYMVLLAALSTLVTLGYVLVEPSPRWFLVLGAGAVAAGLDGVLRVTWRRTFETQEPAPALFMPAMYMLGLPVLVESNVRGLAVIPAALLVGVGFFFIVAAASGSVHPRAPYYGWARTVATIGAYAAGLSLFSLTYILDLSLASAVIATGLVGLMLGVEVMREGEVDPAETIGYAAASGAAVAQWRWGLHFLPLTGYLVGLAVLLGFLVITGILNAQVTRRLDRRAAMEFAAIGALGMLLVVSVRVAGLA